jgi:hypothetical protein
MEIRQTKSRKKGVIKGGSNQRTTQVNLKEEKQNDNLDYELTGK